MVRVPWSDISAQIRQPSNQNMMSRESVSKNVEEHVRKKTPELLRYNTQILGLSRDEYPRKTTLETVNHEKTLTDTKSCSTKTVCRVSYMVECKNVDQVAPLPVALVYDPEFCVTSANIGHLRTQESWIGTPRTNGGSCRPEGHVRGKFWLKSSFDERFIRPSADRAWSFRARQVLPP